MAKMILSSRNLQNISILRKNIIEWYARNKRALPWRDTKGPYKIWVSEIIMQQTRIGQGTEYYRNFLAKYPTIKTLAATSEDELLRLWQGLGYYSRARNMLETAKIVVRDFKGEFPSEYKELAALKGIGEYTAAILLSVCFNKTFVAIDGNAARFLSRLFGIRDSFYSSEGRKIFRHCAEKLIDPLKPGDFNEAIMDIGSMVCYPKNPDCNACPVMAKCFAFNHGEILSLPLRKIKKPLARRYLNYFLMRCGDEIAITKRNKNDIWKNLFQLPLIEEEDEKKLKISNVSGVFGIKVTELKYLKSVNHILTHRKLTIHFYSVVIKDKKEAPGDWIFIKMNDTGKYAFPKPVENFLKVSDNDNQKLVD